MEKVKFDSFSFASFSISHGNMIYLKFKKIRVKPVFAMMLLAALIISIEIIYINSKRAFAQDTGHPVGHVKLIERITTHSPSPYYEIDQAIESENYDEVNRIFKEFESNSDLAIVERASLAQYHGNICFSMNDLHCALTEFKKIIAMREGLPERFYNHTLYLIAQVNFSLENYPDALFYAKLWFDTHEEPNSEAYILVSQAYYMLDEYDKALPNALSGIQKVNYFEKIPKEGALNLLSAIYQKTGQLEKMLPVLEQLIEHYPKEAYQRVQSEVYQKLNRSNID